MAKDPAFLFYYQDFLVGTAFLTFEETGCYVKLLCFMADKGNLSEEQILKKIPPRVWDSLKCKFMLDEETGTFFNVRLQEEVEKRKSYVESRRRSRLGTKNVRGTYVPRMENENIYIQIVEDLNTVCSSNYKHTTPKTRDLIDARIKEGHTVEEFKKVHRNKYNEWHNDEKMCKFLRPETLYGNKFEGYLNQKRTAKEEFKEKYGL